MPSVREMASMVMNGAAGASAYLAVGADVNQSRGIAAAIVNTAAGDVGINSGADKGWDALESAMFATPRVALAASSIASAGFVHTTDILKQLTVTQEQAAGAASILADVDCDIAVLDLAKTDYGYSILGAGSIAFPAGVPTPVWQSSRMGPPVDGGLGATTVAMGADVGADAAACVMLCTERGALAASGLSGFGVTHTTDIAKLITSCREAAVGGASIRADIAFDYLILGLVPGTGDPSLELHGWCAITGGVGAAFLAQTGHFNTIVRVGAGIYDLTLGADQGADANASAIICTPRQVMAPSGMRSIAVAHTDDLVKRITCLQETGGGAASAAADFNFDVGVVRQLI